MRAKKRKMSSVYIFPVLFAVICLSYLIRFIFFNIETEIVKYNSIENVIQTKALLVRHEAVTAMPAGVEINYKVNEGERISSGKKILEIIKSNQTDENIAIKIKELEKRIQEIKQSDINNNFFSQDKEKLENRISDKVSELKSVAKSGDFEKLASIKDDLTADLYKKSLIYGEGSFYGKNLEQLEKEKATLEGIYKNNIDVIYAQTAGVISYKLDGYEQILSPSNIKSFKLDNINEIMNSISNKEQGQNSNTEAGVKLIDNFEWYVCSIMSNEQARGLKEGKGIKLRFGELSNTAVNGEILNISPPEGDLCLVIIKITEHVDDFYKKRIADMEIIKDYNEGFVVPKKSIIVKDDIKGVYVLKSGVVKFVPVAVMTENEEECLVKNVEGYDAIKIFDEVIVTTDRVKENQVLTDKI